MSKQLRHAFIVRFGLMTIILMGFLSVCFAQGTGAFSDRDFPSKKRPKFSQFPCPLEGSAIQDPIIVTPGGVGFHSLQDALDYCSVGKNKSSGRSGDDRGFTVWLMPGTHVVGNFTLPSEIYFVGVGGPLVTSIRGQTGVNKPTLKFAPSGGASESYAWLYGLWIEGKEVAAVECAGSSAWAHMTLEQCEVETSNAIPAVKVSGSGFDPDHWLQVDIDHSTLTSNGEGVTASLDGCAGVNVIESWVEAHSRCVDAQASSTMETELTAYRSGFFGESGIKVDGMGYVFAVRSIIDTELGPMEISNVPEVDIERCKFYSEGADAVVISSSGTPSWGVEVEYCSIGTSFGGTYYGIKAVNNSYVNVAFCGLSTQLKSMAIYADASSAVKAIYNQWRFEQL